MAAPAVTGADLGHILRGPAEQGVDQRRLTRARLAEDHGGAPLGDRRCQLRHAQPGGATRPDPHEVGRDGIDNVEGLRLVLRQIGLGERDERLRPAGVGEDQRPFEAARAQWPVEAEDQHDEVEVCRHDLLEVAVGGIPARQRAPAGEERHDHRVIGGALDDGPVADGRRRGQIRGAMGSVRPRAFDLAAVQTYPIEATRHAHDPTDGATRFEQGSGQPLDPRPEP